MEVAKIIHQMVWGPWTIFLFLGAGIWFTIKSRFFQVRGFGVWWRETVGTLITGNEKKEQYDNEITPFQSACTALAATIGTGNIVGVATALTAGGAGALFWMWVSAFIGMATAYAETSLGQQYRYRNSQGQWICGPMIYMERGLHCPTLGFIYAVFAMCASLGMGSMVQSNSFSDTLSYVGKLSPVWCAVLITGLTGMVILGGIGRIAKVSERLMPLSAGIYMLFSLTVIVSCFDVLPRVMVNVFREAFQVQSAAGGTAGYLLSRSIRYGLSRGVFSNEAGLGSLAVLHGAAEHTTPEQQGMWAMFEVFFDTVIICTMTALVILCIGEVSGMPGGLDGAALTAYCFSKRLGSIGELLVSGAMMVFAFATIIAWYYLGKQTAYYLIDRIWKNETKRRGAERFYTGLYLTAVFLGAICKLDLVWLISDIWNGLMAYPNILALLLMTKKISFPKH